MFLVLVPMSCFAKEPIRSFECIVDRVLDGDTVSCAVKQSGGTYVKIRLYGVDGERSLFLNSSFKAFFTDIAIQNCVESIIVHSTT
jgi:hypothetical protein